MLPRLPPMCFPLQARVAVTLSALVVAGLWSSVAEAQSVTLNPIAVTRSLPLPGRNQYNWANFNDCEQNLVLTFPLVLDSVALTQSQYSLQVWAGDSNADCSDKNTRNAPGTATQVCWPAVNGSVSKSQTLNLPIPIRDIFSQYGAGTKGPYAGPYGEDACHNSALPSGPTTINVWFLITSGDGSSQGTPGKFSLSVDVIGPAPPSSVSAGIAETALILNWSPSGDVDTQGYTVYCDPPAAGAPAPDATPTSTTTTPQDAGTTLVCDDGGFTDGGFDDATDSAIPGEPIDGGCRLVANPTDSGGSSSSGGPLPSSCPSTVLLPSGGTKSTNEAGQTITVGGVQKFVDPAYICGGAGSATSTSTNVTNLIDGVYYTVAVAGIDNYGNTGPLSDPGCNTPQAIIDFWQQYRAAGGLAGGGFCSVDGVGMPATTAPILVFGIWAFGSIVRRRRKK